MQQADEFVSLKDKAAKVADTLRLLANEKRLLVLCHLAQEGEMSVNHLAQAVDLGQSALSQHLARLRADGLVTTRRDAQVLNYRIADGRIAEVLQALYKIYCAPRQ